MVVTVHVYLSHHLPEELDTVIIIHMVDILIMNSHHINVFIILRCFVGVLKGINFMAILGKQLQLINYGLNIHLQEVQENYF